MSDTITRPTSAELRSTLLEQGDKLRELRSLPADKREEKWGDEVREATRLTAALDAEFESARAAEAHELQQAAWDAAVRQLKDTEGRGPTAALGETGDQRASNLFDRAIQSEDYRSWVDGGHKGAMPEYTEERTSFHREYRTLLDSAASPSPGVLLPQGTPIPPVPRQLRMFLRDLIPSTDTTLASVPYVRELNPDTNETAASSVAEGAAKPEVVMEFVDADAPIRKLAAWVPVTEEILSDAPLLRGYIEARLRYMLAFREQAEFLKGNGVAPDIEGIYTVTGTQTQSATNNDVPATVADAIAKVELVDGEASGGVMNPGDFWASVSERRSTQFDGDAIGTAPFGAPPPTLWGLPIVRTRALSTLECLIGDFARGALILDRMGVTLRESDSHDDFFTKNKRAVLVEERVGLAIFRPDFFVKTTLDITA